MKSMSLIKDHFRRFWTTEHSCDKKGCPNVLVVDGGCKPHRKLCDGKLNGIRYFSASETNVITGCSSIPIPGKRFCSRCENLETPALSSEQLNKESRNKLRNERSDKTNSREAPQDNIYIIESILDIKEAAPQCQQGSVFSCSICMKKYKTEGYLITY